MPCILPLNFIRGDSTLVLEIIMIIIYNQYCESKMLLVGLREKKNEPTSSQAY